MPELPVAEGAAPPVEVLADVATPGPRRRRPRPQAPVVVRAVVGAVAVVGLVVLLYALSLRAVPGNSDGATVILEGQSIQAGHLTLHGWYLSYDSFWGIDALVYAVAVLVAGVRSVLLNLVPAIIAAGVVILGIHLARRDSRGAPAWAGGLTVAGLLALPSYALSIFFLQGPLHVGTALWSLGAFALLQPPFARWRWIVAVVLLAAATDGDLQAVALGVVPVGVAGLLAMVRRRDWRAGTAAVSAALAGVVLALVVREVAKLIGTFVVNPSNPTATAGQFVTNLSLAWQYSLKLLGFGHAGFGSGGVPRYLAAVHIVGVAFVLAGVLVAVAELVLGLVRGTPEDGSGRRTWRLDDMLVLGFFGGIVVFVVLTPVAVASYARYLTAPLIFGAILAGRLVARVAAELSSRPRLRLANQLAGAACLAVLACFAACAGFVLAQPFAGQSAKPLVRYLEAHHLRRGIGDYWSSSIVTVESDADVTVRPVTAEPGGLVVSYERNSQEIWYAGKSFQFLVYNTALPFGDVDIDTATATFGRPVRTAFVVGYEVLVWAHRITVAPGNS